MNAQKLFSELSKEFPELQNDPKRWLDTIELLLSVRPKDQPDEAFKTQVQERLRQELRLQTERTPFPWKSMLLGGLSTAAVFSAVGLVFWQSLPTQTPTLPELATPTTHTSTTTANALVAITQDTNKESFGTLAYQETAQPQQAKTEVAVADTSAVMGQSFRSSVMPPHSGRRINIRYKTTDALPEIPTSATVYRKETITERIDHTLLGQADYLPIKADQIQDTTIQSISFQGKVANKAYTFTSQINEGTVTFYEDYNATEVRPASPIYTVQNRLSDQELTTIATKFLTSLQVDTTTLGTAIVEKPWEDENGIQHVPETINVIFPLEISGAQVKTPWGSYEGVSLSINQTTKTVQYGSVPRLSLLASTYDTLSSQELLQRAERGGLSGVTYEIPDDELDVTLTNPRIELRTIQTYQEKTTSYFVPVLVFDTVRDKNDTNYWSIPAEITVPLIKNTVLQ